MVNLNQTQRKSSLKDRYNKLINSPALDEILDKGRDEASYLARKQLSKVYRKVGVGRVRKQKKAA